MAEIRKNDDKDKKNKKTEVDETRPEITVSYNRKLNLGDYNSAELRATVRETPAPEESRVKVIDRLKQEAITEVHDGLEKATGKNLTPDEDEPKKKNNGKEKLSLS